MIDDRKVSGFLEISHTADWAIRVWAPDLAGLMEESARGMYALMECQLQLVPGTGRHFELQSGDAEDLLVAFLAEILNYVEQDKVGFESFNLQVNQNGLAAQLTGGQIIHQGKEIKAVTYHNLSIQQVHGRFEATIVFDV
jgi:SHS2 domain-containing protein